MLLGLQRYAYAGVTIASMELIHDIKKKQFAVWLCVLLTPELHS